MRSSHRRKRDLGPLTVQFLGQTKSQLWPLLLVLEVDVAFLQILLKQTPSPGVKLRLAVLGASQSEISKGPCAHKRQQQRAVVCVTRHESRPRLSQEFRHFWRLPTGMTELKGCAEGKPHFSVNRHSIGQLANERGQQIEIGCESWWQLEEDATQSLTKDGKPFRKIRKQLLTLSQLFEMSDPPRCLHRKAKMLRGLVPPSFKNRAPRHPIESIVQLDAG